MAAAPTPTPDPLAAYTPSLSGRISDIPCEQAVQLVIQKQVAEIDIYKDKDNKLNTILLILFDHGKRSPNGQIFAYLERNIYPPDPPTTACEAQLRQTAQQINKSLPPDLQVVVKDLQTYD